MRRAARKTGNEPALRLRALCDRGNEVARRYGIVHEVPADLRHLYAGRLNLDLATVNGEWALPMPARFVIDRTGVVRFVETDADYRTRPDPATTLAALRVLG